MGKMSQNRKVRDPAEAFELLAEWEQSDEPVSDWCRARGINWRSLVGYKNVSVDELRFVEVALTAHLPGSQAATFRDPPRPG